jgi:hypothetical protein
MYYTYNGALMNTLEVLPVRSEFAEVLHFGAQEMDPVGGAHAHHNPMVRCHTFQR